MKDPARLTLHAEKHGTLTMCGRRMPIRQRVVVRGGPHGYWQAVDTTNPGHGCFTCSDVLWRIEEKAPDAQTPSVHSEEK